MSLIKINSVTKSYGERTLFTIDQLAIEEGARIGLVGTNGSGKTTLFRLIAGLEQADSGHIERNATTALLPQLKETLSTKSGGETTADYVINALNKNPKILLADEPTTHLDMSHVQWIEKAFHKFSGSFVVISHDREFLNRVCTKIWELEDNKIKQYAGNYNSYKKEKEKEKQHQWTEYEKYVKKSKQLQKAKEKKAKQAENMLKTKHIQGDKVVYTESSNDFYQGKAKKLHRVQKSMETRLDKLEKIEKPKGSEAIRMELPEMNKLTNRFIIRANESVGQVSGKVLWDSSTFSLKAGEKVALIGPNGSGKTTLIKKILRGDDRIITLPAIKIGYFSQDLSILDVSRSILDNVKDAAVQSETLIRIVLAQLGFKDYDVHKRVSVLSGGERVKVSLAKLIVGNYNTLILDEPTNFLDLHAVEALEGLLQEYEGSILFVSHDRLFIDHIASKVWAIEDKKVKEFNGTFLEGEKSGSISSGSQDDEELMRIENKIAKVLSDLSILPSEEKDREFQELLRQKRELKSRE